MEEKIRVKDLVESLGVPSKDMLRALRALGLPGRSISVSVSQEDADRLRGHFEMLKSEERREVKPDVIVRKRRKEPVPEAPVARAADQEIEEIDATPPASAPVNAESEVVSEEAGQNKPQTNQRGSHERRARRIVSTPGARVISRPGDEKPAPEPAPEPERKPEPPRKTLLEEIRERDAARQAAERAAAETEKAVVASAESSPDAVSDEKPTKNIDIKSVKPVSRHRASHLGNPDASASPDAASMPTLNRSDEAAPADGAERSRASAPVQVRVISRPTAPAAARRPSGAGRGAPGGGADRPRPGARPAGRPAGFGQSIGQPRQGAGQPLPDQGLEGREGQSKKKRLKGRRTVDFPQGDFGRHPEEDEGMRFNRGKARRKTSKAPQPVVQITQPVKASKRKIKVAEAIRVADMAQQLGVKANEIIKVLMSLGVMATINMALDVDTATLVGSEFGYEVEKTGFSEEEYLAVKEADAPESLKPRPPVVTIMGHVDHGKTSLLDAIRKSNVTSGEAGGITQHIGAYHVSTKRGEIVFLDTPGHEAFTAMRARGAQITDLVILVVAADDGVMEQTREAINHSRAANVPIVVAVNKMDKPGADPDRVLRELSELGLQPEDWGGDTIVAKVSAKTREGLDDLLEMVALQSEIMDLKANPDKAARGHIIEARLDKGRGPVATVLIQEGTLHTGDTFVCGPFAGRVRALIDDQGKKVKEAGPSMPVEVQGFVGVPEAGEEFLVIADEKVARRIAADRASRLREKELASEARVTLETFLAQHADQEALTLNLVLKADVQGSLEAISEALQKQSTDKVKINIIHSGTGAISETDIMLASASQAIIIGFNIKPTARIKDVAEHENVDIRFYDIIYKLVDDVKSAMAGLLAPVQKEVYLGQAEVRQLYNLPKIGVIAGSYVSDGKIARNAGVRLLREGAVVYTGKISSLKRFKDDMREVVKGNECGVGLENFNDLKVGDIIEAFETVEEAATL